jgi:hypothetical protein
MDHPIKPPYFAGHWLFQVYYLAQEIYQKRLYGAEPTHDENRTAAKSVLRGLRTPARERVSAGRARNRDKFTALWRHSL